MSLLLSIVLAVLAAVTFGAASALQQASAHSSTGGGQVAVDELRRLPANPRWRLGVLCDVAGALLLIGALAAGPVTVVQPLQVLALLAAFPVGMLLGGPRFTRRVLVSTLLVVVGLGAFLALLGDPGAGRDPTTVQLVTLSVGFLGVGGVAILLTRRGAALRRALTLGAVSGAWFGLTAVLLRAESLLFSARHFRLFTEAGGLLATACLVVVGVAAFVLTQAAFQTGSLGATLPAQTIADPVVAVILGAALLGEHVPLSKGRLVAYIAAAAAVAIGVRRLSVVQPETARDA